tara:strand:- start:186 stop:602 length:417 start_codon:yes stop_codon:yes gene_type:complete
MEEESYQFLLITTTDWKETLLKYPEIINLPLLNFDLEDKEDITRFIMLTADQEKHLKKYDIEYNLITISNFTQFNTNKPKEEKQTSIESETQKEEAENLYQNLIEDVNKKYPSVFSLKHTLRKKNSKNKSLKKKLSTS